MYGWEKALYTLVTLYVSTRIIDAIHTRHVGQDVRKGDSLTLGEGITTIPATGAYTNENKEMLMIVITRYELYELRGLLNKWTQVHLQTYCKQLGCSDCFEKIKEDQSWSSF